MAAPIRDREGGIVASIGISAPLARFPREIDKEYGAKVVGVANRIGELAAARVLGAEDSRRKA